MNAVAKLQSVNTSRSPDWVLVCSLEKLLPGTGVAALVRGKSVAIFRLTNDRIYAIGNIDPFSDAAILSRGILGDIDGESVVASPMFKQHFRLEDGQCIEDESVAVPSYRILIVDQSVIVQVAEKQ